MRELLSRVQNQLDERAGDAFGKFSDQQFNDWMDKNAKSPEARAKAEQMRKDAQARQGAQSGAKAPPPGSSSSSTKPEPTKPPAAKTETPKPPAAGASSSTSRASTSSGASSGGSTPRPSPLPAPSPSVGSVIGKIASKFAGPAGLALTAKDIYDQGPVTPDQRKGDLEAQAGSKIANQRTRGERMDSGETARAKAADDLRRGSERDDNETAAAASGRPSTTAAPAPKAEPSASAPKATGFGVSGAQSSTGPVAKSTGFDSDKKQTFGQAFAAARKEAGGAGGKFKYSEKEYQTNVAGEKFKPTSQLKPTGSTAPSSVPLPKAPEAGSSATSSMAPASFKAEPPKPPAPAPASTPQSSDSDESKKKTTRSSVGGGLGFGLSGGTRTEETKMKSPMIEAFLKLHAKPSNNLFVEAKKLDPVGKEDGDIDNDGDSDKSDKYLHNRRKAIGKAIKEEDKSSSDPDMAAPKDPRSPKYKDEIESKTEMPKNPPMPPKRPAMKEDVEQIDEIGDTPEGKKVLGNYIKRSTQSATSAAYNAGTTKSVGLDAKAQLDQERKRKVGIGQAVARITREEVEFSEAELTHFASILEMPVAPTPDDYSGSNNGPSKRDLSDETIVETKKKDPNELKTRGRKAGVKIGSYKMKGMTDVEGDEAKAEPKNLAAQNPRTYSKEGKNLVDLEHPFQSGVKRTVPAKEYNSFRSSYLNTEKPEHKVKMHDDYVKRVFN